MTGRLWVDLFRITITTLYLQVNQWMMGVKRLIQQQQLSIREKELLSHNSQITEEQKSTGDSTDNFNNPNTTNSKLSEEDGASENSDTGLSAPNIDNSNTTNSKLCDNNESASKNSDELIAPNIDNDCDMVSSKLNDVDDSASKNSDAGLIAPDIANSDTTSSKLNDVDDSASKDSDSGLFAPNIDNDSDTMSSKLIDGDSAKSEMASNTADTAVSNSSIETLNYLEKSGVRELKTDLEKIDNDNKEGSDSNIASDKISANENVTDYLKDNSDHQNDETK